MPILSNCPKCQQPVTVPDGIEPEGQVRCPLCDAEYPLSEAMASAPPALIPVDAVPADAGPAADTETPAGEGPPLDFWGKTEDSPEIDTGVETGGTPEIDTGAAAADGGAFAAFTPDDESTGQPESLTTTMAKRRKQGKQKSLVKEIPKIIGGGIAGLLIAYYLLNLWKGEQFDYLKVYLPFVEHTKNHWPLGDGKEDPADGADNGKQQPESAKKKAGGQKPKQKSGSQQPINDPAELAGPGNELDDPNSELDDSGNEFDDLGNEFDDPLALPPDEDPNSLTTPDVGVDKEPEKETVEPKDPPSFTADQLGEALKAADEAIHGEGVSGELTDGAYQQFCQLAQVITFAQSGQQLDDRKRATQGLLEELSEKAGQFERVRVLAAVVWKAEEPAQGGILLAGTIKTAGFKDDIQGITVTLPQFPDESITLFTNQGFPVDKGDKVLVLGSIIDNPEENLVGYTGTKPRLIWAGMAQVLPRG